MHNYGQNPGTYYYVNDHLGTPQQLITATGLVVWQAAYLPYGEAQVRINLVENNLRFPGQYFDAESGLHYNWNRYYDAQTGRYISADPIGLDGGMNLYAYVGGNPVNWFDPYGLYSWVEFGDDVSNLSAGFGDTISFGATGLIRDQWNQKIWGYNPVDECSGLYTAGEIGGYVYGAASGGAGGWRTAMKAPGKEFSHWIPNRFGGPRSLWNGNYVTAKRHFKHDKYRYPSGWKKLGNRYPKPIQQFDRIPNVYKGGALGGAAAGASSYVRN